MPMKKGAEYVFFKNKIGGWGIREILDAISSSLLKYGINMHLLENRYIDMCKAQSLS